LGFEAGLLVPAGITVGPVDESVGPVKKPTIKELKRVHQCSTAKAQQLQREWAEERGTGGTFLGTEEKLAKR
jgi:hypothetical protein